MKLTNLQTRPDKEADTIRLIEQEFGYSSEFSFNKDFAPLFNKENFSNLYILLNENDKVIGHSGVLAQELAIKESIYEIAFIGGVAISSDYQGQGLSKKLLNHILNNHKYAFWLLWSEKLDYYKKFGFLPCINQYQYNKGAYPQTYQLTEYKKLSNQQQDQLNKLYNNPSELRPLRENKFWDYFQSTKLYIKQDQEQNIINYFMLDKGQDLQGIIHEYGSADIEMCSYGHLWTPIKLEDPNETHFAALLKVGDSPVFVKLVYDYCGIKVIHIEENKVTFVFNDNAYEEPLNQFLIGIFGPNQFEELSHTPPLFIPGITSI